MQKLIHGRPLACAMAALVGVAAMACSSTSTPQGGIKSGGSLEVAEVAPFTGPDANFGLNKIAGCEPAANLINAAGGIGGNTVTCQAVDTRGDPVDAVPAVQNLLATSSNLIGIVGVTSDEALAVAPTINRAQIPFFTTTGQAEFDTNSLPYFFRLVSPDDFQGYVMALWGHAGGYSRAVAIFGNDIGSQGKLPTLTAGLAKLQSPKLVLSETVALGQTSYRAEIQKMLAVQPDVIFTELDAQSSTTFFSQLKQFNGLRPVILSGIAADPTWYGPVQGAVGTADFYKYFTCEQQAAASSGPAYDIYQKALLALTNLPNPQRYLTNGAALSTYDAVNLIALAALSANSLTPSVFTPYIVKLTQPQTGAVVVDSFAAGKTALAAGHKIQYRGLSGGSGGITFDKSHNSPGEVQIFNFPPGGGLVVVPGAPTFTASQVVALT